MAGISQRCLGVALLGSVLAMSAQGAVTPPMGMGRIGEGVFRRFLVEAGSQREVRVKAFYLDLLPVKNGDFLAFVQEHPNWRRSEVKRIFADESYLRHWAGDLEPGTNAPVEAPVTFVSWFAAKAYAQWKGKRLPTVTEWEYAALASETQRDAGNDPEFRRRMLAWYSAPSSPRLPSAGASPPNFWGVYDLHGLVWEWVADFNSAIVAGDLRADTGASRRFFCGSGGQAASDAEDYAAFMRHAFRSSLNAAYCVRNLGFRCAKDL